MDVTRSDRVGRLAGYRQGREPPQSYTTHPETPTDKSYPESHAAMRGTHIQRYWHAGTRRTTPAPQVWKVLSCLLPPWQQGSIMSSQCREVTTQSYPTTEAEMQNGPS